MDLRGRERDRELTKYPEDEDGDEDAVILPLSWLNNIQQRGRIKYLHVHPSRTTNLFKKAIFLLEILSDEFIYKHILQIC